MGRRLAAGAKVSYHMGKESRTSICTVEIRVSSSGERGAARIPSKRSVSNYTESLEIKRHLGLRRGVFGK